MNTLEIAFNCIKVKSNALEEAIRRATYGNKEARNLVDEYLNNQGQKKYNALRRMVEKYG